MRMYVNKIQDYTGPAGERGHCRLWIFYSSKEHGALVVLTQMPDDAGPGFPQALDLVANLVAAEQGLDPRKTRWFIRRVLTAAVEEVSAVEFTRLAGNRLLDPDLAHSSRDAVQALVHGPVPAIECDEWASIFHQS